MTLTAKANNILGIVSKFRHKKLANSYDMVDIKPSPIFNFCFPANLTMPISSLSGKSPHLSPHTSIRYFTTLPVWMLFSNYMFRNPLAPTFPTTELTPNMRVSFYKGVITLKLLPTIITVKQLTISFLAEFKSVKNVQINRIFCPFQMSSYLSRSHCSVILRYKVFLFRRPMLAFHSHIIAHLAENFNISRSFLTPQ